MVARVRVIASSQRRGRCRKATGGIKVVGKPQAMPWRMPPIKPMSWKGGSQIRPRLSESISKPRAIWAVLCTRLARLSMTPRGAPVAPDVDCKIARRSGAAVGDDRLDARESLVECRRVGRHGDPASVQAAEQRHDEVEPVRTQQQSALS